ncbi:MAG: glycosyltransferase, partial [Actinomycetota bacterium]
IQNANLYFRPDGTLSDIYVKQRPVPFGERVYFRRLLEPLIQELDRVPRDMAAGDEATTFRLGEGRFGSLICYESTYPDLVRTMVNEGAGFLVVSTNNSSYARTAASPQHVAFSQVRAAEHRTWIAHAALSGISAVVAPDGRIVEKTRLFEPAVMSPTIRFARHRTFYGIFGDWVPVAGLAALAVLAAGQAGNALARRRSEEAAAPGDNEDRALVVIPTYNEADSIQQVLDAVCSSASSVSVLVVDDASPDGTAELAQSFSIRNPRVQVMQRDSKQGLGSAYIAGFQWGMQRQFGRFIEMDADLSHDPRDLQRLIEASRPERVAVGSRYTAGGKVTGWSAWRHLLSRAANVYARVLLGLPVNDSTSGFRCYPAQVLRDIGLETVESEGYSFQIEMAYRAHRLGYGIVEVPITFRERASGRSKMSSAIVKEAVFSVARWALRDRIKKAFSMRKTS